ncbi:hypothetical protein CCP2SC5_60011 [Azospirillaceae bacterium]
MEVKLAIRPRVKTANPPPDENVVAAIIGRGAGVAGQEYSDGVISSPNMVASPAQIPSIVMETIPVAAPLIPVVIEVASSAKVEEPPTDPEKKFTLRLPASLLSAIEKDAKDRPDRISVNTWLIGAALQRLRQSNHNVPSGME